MSERFLEFIKKYGFEHNFGMSKVVIVNTKGELLTDETYYLIRIVSWEIENEIVYPDLGLNEEDFSLEAYTNLKGKLLEKFSLPFLYSLAEWKELNNLDSYWD